jgi:type IV pilus assembly protein PilM
MFGRRELLVVDLGTSNVKVLRVVPTQSGGKATGMLVKETGLTTANPQLNDELRDRYIAALSSLLKENSVKTKRAVLSIPGRSVFNRFLKIPPVEGDRLNRIVQFEARQHLPFPLEEVRIEYEAYASEHGDMDVSLLAVKRDALAFYIDIMRKCGLSIVSIDISSLALFNVYVNSTQRDPADEVVALADIGASTCDIVVESEGKVRFMRRARVGGNSLTAMLAQEMGQEFEMAEGTKLRSSEEGLPEMSSTSRISEVLLRGFDRIAGDLKNTLDYYVSQPDGLPVNRLYITGGTSRFKTLAPILEDRLGIPVEVLRPFQVESIDMEAISSEELQDISAVSIGLGLKGVSKASIDLNFTPEHILEQQQMAKRRPALMMQAGLVFGLVGCSLVIASSELETLRGAANEIHMLATNAGIQDVNIKNALIEDKLLKDRFTNLETASNLRGSRVRFMLELGKLKPSSVWVKSLGVSQKQIRVIIGYNDTKGRSEFIRLIKISPYFIQEKVQDKPFGENEHEITIQDPLMPLEETRAIYEQLQNQSLNLYEIFSYNPNDANVQVGMGLIMDVEEYPKTMHDLANAIVLGKSVVLGLSEERPNQPKARLDVVWIKLFDGFWRYKEDWIVNYVDLEAYQQNAIDWPELNKRIQRPNNNKAATTNETNNETNEVK